MKIRLLGSLAVAGTLVAVATACSGPSGSTITVSAATSLRPAFEQLRAEFEAANPGTRVQINYGGSASLAAQVNQGAPVDVFAAASSATMDAVVAAGNAADPTVIARNSMVIATPPDNPGQVGAISDLAKPTVSTVLCQVRQPCGAAAEVIFSRARLDVAPVSREPNVAAVMTKVMLGQADAGLVYVTDVRAAGERVDTIPIPAADNAFTSYPIAVTRLAQGNEVARLFVAFVVGPDGQSALRNAGFDAP